MDRDWKGFVALRGWELKPYARDLDLGFAGSDAGALGLRRKFGPWVAVMRTVPPRARVRLARDFYEDLVLAAAAARRGDRERKNARERSGQ